MGEVAQEKKWRHGDVYGIASDVDAAKLAASGKRLDSGILAYGEVTGHVHELDAPPSQYQRYELEGKRFLVVSAEGGIAIKHAEHGVGVIPAGVWEERIDREFDYLTHDFRPVFD
jgi:hypothetical protein